jgi:hypothetical protein
MLIELGIGAKYLLLTAATVLAIAITVVFITNKREIKK